MDKIGTGTGDDVYPLLIAMKGHPGTGKSTLARRLAAALRFPLLDKDDVRDCTLLLQQSSPDSSTAAAMLNDLSYSVLWKMAETQLEVGLSVVVDSPLSRRSHLDSLVELAGRAGARVAVVECRPGDEVEWRRRLERRGEGSGASWHKPSTWQDLIGLVRGYEGCAEYDVGPVARIVLDTTGGADVDALVEVVLQFVGSNKWQ